MRDSSAFEGFSEERLQFLAQLEQNNNREWFQAHKEDYLKSVQVPALDFVFALGERLKKGHYLRSAH